MGAMSAKEVEGKEKKFFNLTRQWRLDSQICNFRNSSSSTVTDTFHANHTLLNNINTKQSEIHFYLLFNFHQLTAMTKRFFSNNNDDDISNVSNDERCFVTLRKFQEFYVIWR
jgi:hypothetical protein